MARSINSDFIVDDAVSVPKVIPRIVTTVSPTVSPTVAPTVAPIYNPPRVVKTLEKQIDKKSDDMTAFKNTIVGKLIGKGVSAGKTIASVVSSPNPIQAAASALSGGVAQAKKEAVNETRSIQTVQKSVGQSTSTSTTSGWMEKIKANKTILGITFPLWIWFAMVGIVLFIAWKFLFKRRSSGGVRRSSARRGTSAMRSRMARVRAARRRKK